MTVISKIYAGSMSAAFNQEMNFVSDDMRCGLYLVGYTPDPDVHDYKNDLSSEISATGYTANGQALTGKTKTYTALTRKFVLNCDNPSWGPTVTFSLIRSAVFYDRTPGSDATRPLLCYYQSDTDLGCTSDQFQVTIPATGLCEFTLN